MPVKMSEEIKIATARIGLEVAIENGTSLGSISSQEIFLPNDTGNDSTLALLITFCLGSVNSSLILTGILRYYFTRFPQHVHLIKNGTLSVKPLVPIFGKPIEYPPEKIQKVVHIPEQHWVGVQVLQKNNKPKVYSLMDFLAEQIDIDLLKRLTTTKSQKL